MCRLVIADRPERLLALRDDPASTAPERAIVFEVAGSLKNFYQQAVALGLEYLGDFEDDFDPTADFHDRDDPRKVVNGRIYLAMPDVRALQALLSLWQRYIQGQRMQRGRGGWTELFSQLIDVRPWGHGDRVPPGTMSYWREELARHPDRPVRFEVELWYYERSERREAAFRRLEQEVVAVNNSV